MNDELFNNIKRKTNVDKDALLGLAQLVEQNGLKDENTLKKVIKELSSITGKHVTPQLEDKIINTIIEDKVPKSIDKLF